MNIDHTCIFLWRQNTGPTPRRVDQPITDSFGCVSPPCLNISYKGRLLIIVGHQRPFSRFHLQQQCASFAMQVGGVRRQKACTDRSFLPFFSPHALALDRALLLNRPVSLSCIFDQVGARLGTSLVLLLYMQPLFPNLPNEMRTYHRLGDALRQRKITMWSCVFLTCDTVASVPSGYSICPSMSGGGMEIDVPERQKKWQ